MAERLSYERLTPEGSADGRRVARVVNSLRDGQINSVADAGLPEAAEDVSVPDRRVSEQSCVLVMQPWWITGVKVDEGVVTFTCTAGAAGRVLRYVVLG